MNFQIAGIGLAVPPGQLRLRIEKVHLTGTAVLKQADHRLRPRRMVWGLRGEWVFMRSGMAACETRVGGQQVRERERAEAAGVSGQEGTAGDGKIHEHTSIRRTKKHYWRASSGRNQSRHAAGRPSPAHTTLALRRETVGRRSPPRR